MNNIRSIDQFRTELNDALKDLAAHPVYRENSSKVSELKESFVSFAEDIIRLVPESTVRVATLNGLIGNAYVLAGVAVGLWSTKAAA